jgi:hypothetical protein
MLIDEVEKQSQFERKSAVSASRILVGLYNDESGQSTVEYVLLISIMVGVVLSLGNLIKQRMLGFLKGAVGNYVRFAPIYRFKI